MSDMDKKRYKAVKLLKELGYIWIEGEWKITATPAEFNQLNISNRTYVQQGAQSVKTVEFVDLAKRGVTLIKHYTKKQDLPNFIFLLDWKQEATDLLTKHGELP
jgi:hypothetical protein